MISKYHKLKPRDSHTHDHSEFIHDHVIFSWIAQNDTKMVKFTFVLPVHFRSDKFWNWGNWDSNLILYIFKNLFESFLKFVSPSRGQAGFYGTWNSETEILSDDLENNHVSKVTEFLNHVFKYQMANLQISKMFVFVCSCLSVWTVSVRSTCSILCSASDVWNPLFMRSCPFKNFYNLHCIV